MQTKQELQQLLLQLYITQAFDHRAKMLQKTGHIGTFPSSKGQEHLFVSLANHLTINDWYCPYYRDHGALITRGMPIHALFQYWAGDERGNSAIPPHTLPINIPIGSQCAHATGIAWSLKHQDAICLVTLGDGATSKGEVYESLNFAQIHKLPILFVVNNNQFAISTELSQQSSNPLIANKFSNIISTAHIPHGPILEIDQKIKAEITKVKTTRSPLLLEVMTLRLDPHTTNDDALIYRSSKDIELDNTQYPISQFEQFLLSRNLLSAQNIQSIKTSARATVDQAAQHFLNAPSQEANHIKDYLYA